MKVRAATPADVLDIQKIGRSAWPPTYAFAGPEYIEAGLDAWWSEEALASSLVDTIVVVMEDDGGELVGMANVDLRQTPPVIWKLYVLPDHQGEGIGSALMNDLLGRLPSGARAVQLEYTDGNVGAAGFYQAVGFSEIRRTPGERPGWPDAIWLERSL